MPVPSHWETEEAGDCVYMHGALVNAMLREHFFDPGTRIEEQALEIEESDAVMSGQRRPLFGPRTISPPGSQRRFSVFERTLPGGWMRRSYYFEESGRLAQFALEAPSKTVDAFEGVILRMLGSFRFIRGSGDHE